MSTAHSRRARILSKVPLSDAASLAVALRPLMAELRALAEDATADPSKRIHARAFLRQALLRSFREVESHLDVAAALAPSEPAPEGRSS